LETLPHELTGILAVFLEKFLNLVADITLWNLDIILGRSIVRHKGEETVVGNIKLRHRTISLLVRSIELFVTTYKLIFLATNIWNIHIVGGWAQIFELLAGENINGDKMDLSVTVLSSLGGGHFDDLAWALFDDDEAVLPQGRALHRVGG
jgi:hypothetical protein